MQMYFDSNINFSIISYYYPSTDLLFFSILSFHFSLLSGRHITTVTHDMSEQSLKKYTGYTTEKKRKEMSHILSREILTEDRALIDNQIAKRRKSDELPQLDRAAENEPLTMSAVPALAAANMNDIPDLRDIDLDDLGQIDTLPVIHSQTNNTLMVNNAANFQAPQPRPPQIMSAMYNCNVIINNYVHGPQS